LGVMLRSRTRGSVHRGRRGGAAGRSSAHSLLRRVSAKPVVERRPSEGGGLSAGGWGRMAGAGAPTSHHARRPPYGYGLDRSQRGRDRLLPASRNQLTPALPKEPQVGPDLPIVAKPGAGATGQLGKHERLHDMGDRPADQPKVDPLGWGEPDRLHRLSDQAQPPLWGEMGSQDHVVAAFQHRSLSASARGARPRYGSAMTSKTTSRGAAMSTSWGPSGRTRRPMPRSTGQAPVTSPT
jgi:hypothetical protein